jgi:hypothetical protein
VNKQKVEAHTGMYEQKRGQQQMLAQQLVPIERFRQIFASTVILFYIGWLLWGLVTLASQGSWWLLVSSFFLTYPVSRIVKYYFETRAERLYE